MKHLAFALFMMAGVFASACGDDNPGTGADAAVGVDNGGGGGNRDAEVVDNGNNTPVDTGVDGGVVDLGGGPVDMGSPVDMGVDGGMTGPLEEEMEAGAYVQVVEARINVGDGTGMSANSDTFASVKTKLGPGTRTVGAGARSYEWNLTNAVHLTVWFGDTNLDNDDDPPSDVDDTDEVLWIAVEGGFSGKTTRDVGLGSMRSDVEIPQPNGYGPAPHPVDITDPAPGVVAAYYTQGIVVNYDSTMVARKVTICRAYNTEPEAELKPDLAALDFAIGAIAGFHNTISGSSRVQISNVLSFPDGEGDTPDGYHVWSYSFIGIEVSFLGAQNVALFLTVHPPYYGPLDNTSIGLGSTRADFEAALNMGAGSEAATPNVICYPEMVTYPSVVVVYDANDLVTEIRMGLLSCM